MDQRREELHILLKPLATNVYFQPPQTVKMEYPCIVYQRDNAHTQYAGNLPYRFNQRYQVTVIDRNPDGDIREKVRKLPLCRFERFFTANGLNHDIFVLYF